MSGFAPFDFAIVAIYVVGVLIVGRILSRRVSGENDFFLAGRRLGKPLQFFLNFGNTTDPSTATATTSSVYLQGAAGGWLGLISLFQTPYYWFMNVWFRRTRLVTTADLFEARFGGRFLAVLYSSTAILTAIVAIAFSNVAALKTLQPILAKPLEAQTPSERRSVEDYGEFARLRRLSLAGELPAGRQDAYDSLRGLYERGAIGPYVSVLSPEVFLSGTALLVAVFVSLGGLRASAVIGAAQAVLVATLSIAPIPLALARLGGAHALHLRLPARMFQIFGSDLAGDYTWYSILAFQVAAFIGTHASYGNMNISGAARTEETARFGAVTATLGKRVMTVSWCLSGLLAAALFAPGLADPDQSWGLLARTFLPQGLMGVAVAGILGGTLSYSGSNAVVVSSLVVKNLYEPLVRGRSQAHYVAVARGVVFVVLALGAWVAFYFRSVTALFKLVIALTVSWGAPIMLIFLWRRLTETAVRVQVIATVLFIGILPWVVSATPALCRLPALTRMTVPRTVGSETIEPVSIFFEGGVARVNPLDPHSAKEGLGRFSIEVYSASLLGVDVANLTSAGLLAIRYLADAAVPLFLLIAISLATRPGDPVRCAQFHARLKTPVGPTPDADALAVAESRANPERFDHLKLFPGSNWELMRWTRKDTAGFFLCLACVLAVLALFDWIVTIGS